PAARTPPAPCGSGGTRRPPGRRQRGRPGEARASWREARAPFLLEGREGLAVNLLVVRRLVQAPEPREAERVDEELNERPGENVRRHLIHDAAQGSGVRTVSKVASEPIVPALRAAARPRSSPQLGSAALPASRVCR